MQNRTTIQPTSEPVTLAEMRNHLGITQLSDTSRDAIISSRIISARQWSEQYTRTAYINQTITGYAADFPYNPWMGNIILLKAPLVAVNSIKYLDENGAQQTLNSSKYLVDLVGSSVVPAYNEDWPSVRAQLNAVQVEYISGFGAASPTPTQTVFAGAYTAAASTTASDKWLFTIDNIYIVSAAVGAGGVLAATLQAGIDAFAVANIAYYTVSGTVAGANLQISKLDGTEIIISSVFTDATGLLPAIGTTSGGTFATTGFIGSTTGATASLVPESIKDAIKFIVGQWEVFQNSIEGVVRPFTIPNAAKQLLDNYVDMREYF
jgi:uncharacterized phiE125 gp8 family phage protein